MKIIKIGAMWCPACIIVNKYWNKIKTEHKEIEFLEYDIDLDEKETSKYSSLDILPVIIKLIDDKEVDRICGEKSKEEITMFIEGEKYEK